MPTFRNIIISFNNGAQIISPPGSPTIRFRFTDLSTGKLEEEGTLTGDPCQWTIHVMNRKYYVPWQVKIMFQDGVEFTHDFNAKGQHVLMDVSPGALGDTLAWFPACVAFQEKWQCKMTVAVREPYRVLFDGMYRDITIVGATEANQIKAGDTYARYKLAVWNGTNTSNHERMPFQRNNLQIHADMILGVDSHATPPRIAGKPFHFKKKTVCIATRASRKCKEWNRNGGWEELTAKLIRLGYDVVCIDKDNKNCPPNAIDATGDRPLTERVSFLRGATLFVGLPSGLSWMAYACHVPIVLISGFTDVVRHDRATQRYPEFDTPYRVSSPENVCKNCWSTIDQWREGSFAVCPFDKKNECTATIPPELVYQECLHAIHDRELATA